MKFEQTVFARAADQRSAVFHKALELGHTYIRDTKVMLLRMNLSKHDFVVKGHVMGAAGNRIGCTSLEARESEFGSTDIIATVGGNASATSPA